jgi:putative nucleotidyltransferase with HDIG domain
MMRTMVDLLLKNKPRGRSLLIVLLVLVVLLPLWWRTGLWYKERLLNDARAGITGAVAVHSRILSSAIQQRLSLFKGIKAFADHRAFSADKVEPGEFIVFAALLTSGTTGIRSVIVAPEGIAQFVYPLEGNEVLVGQDLFRDRRGPARADVQRTIRSQRIVLSGPYAVRPKGLELVARQVVYRGENLWGLVSVAFDITPAFAEAAMNPLPAGLELILQDRTGQLLYGKKSVLEDHPVVGSVAIHDGDWKLAAVPAGGWNAAIAKPLLQFRGITLAIVLLLTALLYFLLSYRSRLKLAVRQRTDDLQRMLANRREEEEHLNRSLINLRRAMGATFEAMAVAVEKKEPLSSGHQRRVADLARTIATEMGLPEDVLDGLRMAAMIHDIGKISLPEEILGKPARLSEEEYAVVKTHAQVGYEILKEIDVPWPVARLVWQHHERLDGSGYPRGLSGEEILPEARILAVADVVEAMASQRCYRPTPGLEKALEEIQAQRGLLYDPDVVDACLRIFREKDFRLA